MSGQASGWVMRHGPCTTWAAKHGVKKDRSAQAVLLAIADGANRDGEEGRPGMAAMIDASGYGRSTVFEALDRLERLGYVTITEQGGGRGLATVYTIPGVARPEWRPGEKVQIPDGDDDRNGPDQTPKRSRSDAETVQISPDVPLFSTGSNEKPNVKLMREPEFDAFYAAYPRRVAPAKARAAYVAARKRASAEQIIEGVTRYATECRGKEPRFVAHPSTWLNGDRWLDEPGTNREPAKSGARPIMEHDPTAPASQRIYL